jgi:hypothetical protein
VTGDTYHLSGDFRGAVVNVRSTLTQVQQTIGALPRGDDAEKDELRALVDRLGLALEGALEQAREQGLEPSAAGQGEEAEAVALQAELLVQEAAKERPNRSLLKVTGQGLVEAARAVATTAPQVLDLAERIAATVSRIVAA